MAEQESNKVTDVWCPKCWEPVWDVATPDQALYKCWKCGARWTYDSTTDTLYDPDHLNPAKGGNRAADDYWGDN